MNSIIVQATHGTTRSAESRRGSRRNRAASPRMKKSVQLSKRRCPNDAPPQNQRSRIDSSSHCAANVSSPARARPRSSFQRSSRPTSARSSTGVQVARPWYQEKIVSSGRNFVNICHECARPPMFTKTSGPP
jgi:hypothetical protein